MRADPPEPMALQASGPVNISPVTCSVQKRYNGEVIQYKQILPCRQELLPSYLKFFQVL